MNAKKIVTLLGVLFVLAGLVGFASPGMMRMHLTPAHNVVHLISGALALYFSVKGTIRAAKAFAIVFGAVYALLGVAGFVAPPPEHMLTIIPNQLMFGTADHIVHLILGGVLFVAGLSTSTAPVPRSTPGQA